MCINCYIIDSNSPSYFLPLHMMHQGHFCNFRHFCPKPWLISDTTGRFLALHQDKKFSSIAKSANIDEFLKLELESLEIRFFNYLQCGAWQKQTHIGILGHSGHLSVLIPRKFLDTRVMHRHSSQSNGQQQRYAFNFWAGGCYPIQLVYKH